MKYIFLLFKQLIAYFFSCVWFGKQVASDERTKVLVGTGSSSGLVVSFTPSRYSSVFVLASTVP